MIVLGPQSVLSQMLNSFLQLFGIAPVHMLFSPFAVLVAMVYVHLPFMVLPLYTNLESTTRLCSTRRRIWARMCGSVSGA